MPSEGSLNGMRRNFSSKLRQASPSINVYSVLYLSFFAGLNGKYYINFCV